MLGSQPGRHLGYYDLMEAVFPHATNERAYRCAHQGGPPGCAMALGKALRELGCYTTGQGGDREVYLPPEDPVAGYDALQRRRTP